MAMIEVNWNPGRRDLRVFGLAALVVSAGLATWLHLARGAAPGWLLAIGGFGVVTFGSALVAPGLCRVLYVALVAVTLPIGMLVSFLAMATLYFLVITPVAVVFRLFGRDLLELRFTRDAESYWVRRSPGRSAKRYFDQF